MRRAASTLAMAGASLLMGGCAGLSPDGGFGPVDQLAQARIGQAPSLQRSASDTAAAQARVAVLLAQPLTADSAVEVALRNHRGLQAGYARLGLADADLARAGRLPNPSLRLGRLAGGGAVEIDRAIGADLLGLLTLPLARQAAQGQLAQVQLQAAADTVAVASQARQAFFEAVAAQQLAGYFAQVQDAADTASELARRMVAAGNFSPLALLREQAFQAEATSQLARARQQALAAREQLVRALGLGDNHLALRLPERLPDLPAAPSGLQQAEQAAMDQRLDLQLARRQTEDTARALGLTRATRFVNVLHAGYQNQSSSGEPRRNGWEVELELPLFDGGSSRMARAEAVYSEALHRTAALAVQAQSEVREAHAAYRSAYDLARHYRDTVVPLRQRITDEQLLRYNGMLASVFDLLADARGQIAAVSGAVVALRDHWVAETRLQAALTGGAPSPGLAATNPAAASGLPAAAGGAAGSH